MYISIEQIDESLRKLDSVHPFIGTSFLAFKIVQLPIETCTHIDIADQERFILDTYYNPYPESKYYYVPLRGGGPKDRWLLKNKYPTSGLQKMRTSTFSEVFLHTSDTDEWAWEPNYVLRIMRKLHNKKVPVLHLAIWLLRDSSWPDNIQAEDIIEKFFTDFHITSEERDTLFDTSISDTLPFAPILQPEPITRKNLRELIGLPKDASPEEDGGLDSLALAGVGPARNIELKFASRLNIITGDNGLGKTFLLECAYWALSGQWADPGQPAYPRSDYIKPYIRFHISGAPPKPKIVYFDKATQSWPIQNESRPALPGIVIYARVDGSCMIWDPAQHYWLAENDRANGLEALDAIRLSSTNIWDGLDRETRDGKKKPICNGLIRDWINWQYRPSIGAFETFKRVLLKLSPTPNEMILDPGEPLESFSDSRDMPTIKMPYGDVPVVLLSAGIKRILSMAYLLVWTWEGHKSASRKIGKTPQSKIVFIIDEMEAHLHPRWQRVIVPALLDVVKELSKQLEVQLIIATHSPLVLASVEPLFSDEADKLFALDLINQEVEAKELQYIKYGSINSWLTSEVFDLKRPYSVEAEEALIAAKQIQISDNPDAENVQKISDRLAKYLPDLDPFWPRWRFFAEKHGVKM
jgi:AAA domain, putative AbiEii toxin, Type IV TA system